MKHCVEIAARNPYVAKISPTTDNQHGTNNAHHWNYLEEERWI